MDEIALASVQQPEMIVAVENRIKQPEMIVAVENRIKEVFKVIQKSSSAAEQSAFISNELSDQARPFSPE